MHHLVFNLVCALCIRTRSYSGRKMSLFLHSMEGNCTVDIIRDDAIILDLHLLAWCHFYILLDLHILGMTQLLFSSWPLSIRHDAILIFFLTFIYWAWCSSYILLDFHLLGMMQFLYSSWPSSIRYDTTLIFFLTFIY